MTWYTKQLQYMLKYCTLRNDSICSTVNNDSILRGIVTKDSICGIVQLIMTVYDVVQYIMTLYNVVQ